MNEVAKVAPRVGEFKSKLEMCDYFATRKAYDLFLQLENVNEKENLITPECLDYILNGEKTFLKYHAVEIQIPRGYLHGIKQPNVENWTFFSTYYTKTNKFSAIAITEQEIKPLDPKNPSDLLCTGSQDYFSKYHPKVYISFYLKHGIKEARFAQGFELELPLFEDEQVREVLCGIKWKENTGIPQTILTSPVGVLHKGNRLYKYYSIDENYTNGKEPIEKYFLSPQDTFFEAWNCHKEYEELREFEISKKEYEDIVKLRLPKQRKQISGLGNTIRQRFSEAQSLKIENCNTVNRLV